jgi:hypothetical protein
MEFPYQPSRSQQDPLVTACGSPDRKGKTARRFALLIGKYHIEWRASA